MAGWLSSATTAISSLTSGFRPQLLAFPSGLQVMTHSLLAEGGYSFIYGAKEVSTSSGRAREFAAKKVLAQDGETREIAETEAALLTELASHPACVRCHGVLERAAPSGAPGVREFWMLLEMCPNGSLIDLIYKKLKRMP